MNDERKLLTVREFAKREGVDPKRIQDRIKNGSLPAEKKGNRWYIDPIIADQNPILSNNLVLRDQPGDNRHASPLHKARTEREKALAEIKQMEAGKMRGELIEVRIVERETFKEARRVRDAFLNMPARIAAEIAVETDPHKVEYFLDKEIREILEQLAVMKIKNDSAKKVKNDGGA